MPKSYGWVLLGGKRWYRVYADKPDKNLYYLKDGVKHPVTKHHPAYSNEEKAVKELR
jgi:hypothetical protein